MKNTKKYTGNKRVLDVPSVLNEVEYVDGVPIGMTEDAASTKSANFGTPRDSIKAGALVGNGSMYVDIPNDDSSTSSFELDLYFSPTASGYSFGRAVENTNDGLANSDGWMLVETKSSNSLSWVIKTTTLRTVIKFTYTNDVTYHIKCGYDGVDSYYYVDDVLIGSVTVEEPYIPSLSGVITLFGKYSGVNAGMLFDLKYIVNGIDRAHYKTQEGSGNTAYDSSGNNNHGSIINPYEGMWGEHNGYSYADEEGYSDGVSGEIIPKDDSTTNLDVLGNPLQYIGKCPSKAEYVESPCFEGDGSGWSSAGYIPELALQNIEVEYYWKNNNGNFGDRPCSIQAAGVEGIDMFTDATESKVICRTVGGASVIAPAQLTTVIGKVYKINHKVYGGNAQSFVDDIGGNIVSLGGNPIAYSASGVTTIGAIRSTGIGALLVGNAMWGLKVFELDNSGNRVSELRHWPLTEPIKDAANHTYHDVSGNGNHATLINGSVANEGVQDVFHYNELGYGKGFNGNLARYASRALLDNISGDYLMVIKFKADPNSSGLRNFCYEPAYFLLNSGKVSFYSATTSDKTDLAYRNDGVDYRDNEVHEIRLFTRSTSDLGDWKVDNGTTQSFYLFNNSIDLGEIGLYSPISTRVFDFDLFSIKVYENPTTIDDDLSSLTLHDSWDLSDDRYTYYDSFATQIEDTSGIFEIPALSTDLTKDALGNPLTVTQDGKSFLGTCNMKHVEMGRAIEADDGLGFWFTPTGVANTKELTDFTGVIGDQLLSDGGSNIRTHKKALVGRQLLTEKKITNN